MPVTTAGGKYSVVEGISFDDEEAMQKLTKTIEELQNDRFTVDKYL